VRFGAITEQFLQVPFAGVKVAELWPKTMQ
jgi:hypothetical protein